VSLRRWVAGLALAAASTILILAGAEMAARIYLHHLEGGPGTIARPLAVFDPVLGWSKPAGVTAVIQRSEYCVHETINAHGLRGPDRPYEKPSGVRRVMLLGNSFLEAANVEEEQTMRSVLEARLVARGRGAYEVINGGTAGYSTDQEYLFYQREGARYAPDVVVMIFYYNDLIGVLGGEGGKPYFELGDSGLVLRNSPVPPPGPQWNRDRRNRFVFRPWRGSYALCLLSHRTEAGNPELHRLLARVGLTEPIDDTPPSELWPYGLGHRAEVLEMWRRFTALLSALQAEVAAAGGQLVLFYAPAAFESDDRAWDLTRRRYRLGRRWDRDRVAGDLRAAADGLSVPFVDPRPELRAALLAGRRTNFMVDGHWNAVGNELAAEALERAVR
jgi:hypothetical protein